MQRFEESTRAMPPFYQDEATRVCVDACVSNTPIDLFCGVREEWMECGTSSIHTRWPTDLYDGFILKPYKQSLSCNHVWLADRAHCVICCSQLVGWRETEALDDPRTGCNHKRIWVTVRRVVRLVRPRSVDGRQSVDRVFYRDQAHTRHALYKGVGL